MLEVIQSQAGLAEGPLEPDRPTPDLESEGNLRPVGPVIARKVEEQPDSGKKDSSSAAKRTSLIEIPLSSLRGPDEGEDGPENISESVSDPPGNAEQRSVGFFFKVGELLL
ncbi:hypothetical protein chiPu_0005505 [Chiloscyllium punctatum]|uniref:Uncharacterized protein n=1 Tax=Chiloscyllium punctatum TaxID=137246 RepID=A0A401S9N9_CHIPU|nr:hypothetical protein [Chiloscyllium punctatum]